MVAEIILGVGWPLILAVTIYYGLGLRRPLTWRRALLPVPFGEVSRFYTKLTYPIYAAILLTLAISWDERLPWFLRLPVCILVLSITAAAIWVAFNRGLRPERAHPDASAVRAEESVGYAESIRELEDAMLDSSNTKSHATPHPEESL